MQGDIQDHESLVAALKQVDVVISTLGGAQIGDQLKLITAIKEVGHITVCQSHGISGSQLETLAQFCDTHCAAEEEDAGIEVQNMVCVSNP
jgi:uncharacterized protein YbjT (DUF2867 family)